MALRKKNGATWRNQNMVDNKLTRMHWSYTMEAWLVENPDICAHLLLYCYEDSDISGKDINDMQKTLVDFINEQHPDKMLAFKLYDQRGIVLTVKGC